MLDIGHLWPWACNKPVHICTSALEVQPITRIISADATTNALLCMASSKTHLLSCCTSIGAFSTRTDQKTVPAVLLGGKGGGGLQYFLAGFGGHALKLSLRPKHTHFPFWKEQRTNEFIEQRTGFVLQMLKGGSVVLGSDQNSTEQLQFDMDEHTAVLYVSCAVWFNKQNSADAVGNVRQETSRSIFCSRPVFDLFVHFPLWLFRENGATVIIQQADGDMVIAEDSLEQSTDADAPLQIATGGSVQVVSTGEEQVCEMITTLAWDFCVRVVLSERKTIQWWREGEIKMWFGDRAVIFLRLMPDNRVWVQTDSSNSSLLLSNNVTVNHRLTSRPVDPYDMSQHPVVRFVLPCCAQVSGRSNSPVASTTLRIRFLHKNAFSFGKIGFDL